MSMFNVNIYIKNKTLIAQRVIFRFLPNLRIYTHTYTHTHTYIYTYIYTLGTDGITIRIMIESILVRRAVCKNICLNILTAWDTVVSLTMFQ